MRFWIAVVSREHVLTGMAGRFAQACHGKSAPLKRMKAGDWLIFYSPKLAFRGKEPYQCFTAIGRIRTGDVYQHDMGGGFKPFRVDVDFIGAREANIRPLIPELSFIRNKKHWGAAFRFGHLGIPPADFELIAHAMGIDVGAILSSGAHLPGTAGSAEGAAASEPATPPEESTPGAVAATASASSGRAPGAAATVLLDTRAGRRGARRVQHLPI